jgi:hypothetical protein
MEKDEWTGLTGFTGFLMQEKQTPLLMPFV